jgi:hypothetical protein
MIEDLRCPKCGAPYKQRVPDWVTCVQCSYCKTAILIQKKTGATSTTKIVRIEEVVEEQKTKPFSLAEFSEFMKTKGYLLDPVSGLLKMGQFVVSVSDDGIVEGPEPCRTRAEKWISKYMKQ